MFTVNGCKTIEELVTLWKSYSGLNYVDSYRLKRNFFHELSEFFFRADRLSTKDDLLTDYEISRVTILSVMRTAEGVNDEIVNSFNGKYFEDSDERLQAVSEYVSKWLMYSSITNGVCKVTDTKTNKTWIMSCIEWNKL